jgi:peptidoglycan/xylan/chitin deacetylase (PgdA/CDA1 family)
MIGVVANPSDALVVREFFELFKTPWEFYRQGRCYDALLCDGDLRFDEECSHLILRYSSQPLDFDAENCISGTPAEDKVLSFQGSRIPIYGTLLTFEPKSSGSVARGGKVHAICSNASDGRVVVRIGYDLFPEVRTLLTAGQPVCNAAFPTLDLHIALLRKLMVDNGTAVVEIPAIPSGHNLTACLTHDVDHPSVRLHRFDHTMMGFLARATVGSLIKAARGRMSLRQVVANWAACVKLPFVYLGLAEDYWLTFNRYLDVEGGLPSTFFVIPIKNAPGRCSAGTAPRRRASAYDAADVAQHLRHLVASGCEVGLHGLDIWFDPLKGREELNRVRDAVGCEALGTRVHWLYFEEQSPTALELSGAEYDSTVGYNESIGYRAGTAQAYRPIGVQRLLELPLQVMDTAMFRFNHMDLTPAQAAWQVRAIMDHVAQAGGCFTVNWHDRSLAPERLWGEFYRRLIDDLRARGAWFATASQVVSWFRKRRSAVFERDATDAQHVRVRIPGDAGQELPGLRLRIHKPAAPHRDLAIAAEESSADFRLKPAFQQAS